MRPSEALEMHRDEVKAIIAKYPVSNPRVFGSVARGEDVEGSDLDMVFDVEGPFSYFDMAGLARELEAVLGCSVDLGTARSLKSAIADSVYPDFRTI